MGRSIFVFVLVAIVSGHGESVVLVNGVQLRFQIAFLLLELVDLRFVSLLLGARLLQLLIELVELGAVQRCRDLLDVASRLLDLDPDEITLVLLPFARIVRKHHCNRDQEKQKTGDRKPLVQIENFVEPVAASFDI